MFDNYFRLNNFNRGFEKSYELLNHY